MEDTVEVTSLQRTLPKAPSGLSYSANTVTISEEWATSLQWTKWSIPVCSLTRGSTGYGLGGPTL